MEKLLQQFIGDYTMKCPNCNIECELVNVKSKLSYECGCGFTCPVTPKHINDIYHNGISIYF